MRRRGVIGAILCALLIAADRISKAWAASELIGNTVTLIPGVVSLCYAENTGAAFGMLAGMRLLNALLTLSLLIALGLYMLHGKDRPGYLICGSVLMAGGLSHLYDRLLGRNIIDMIRLDFIQFPIFNVADICICVGAALLAIAYIRHENTIRSKKA